MVAAFAVSAHGHSASPLFHESPYLSGLNLEGKYLEGTIVASSVGGLPDVKKLKHLKHSPPDVSVTEGGLDVEPKQGKVQHSVPAS